MSELNAHYIAIQKPTWNAVPNLNCLLGQRKPELTRIRKLSDERLSAFHCNKKTLTAEMAVAKHQSMHLSIESRAYLRVVSMQRIFFFCKMTNHSAQEPISI